MHERTVLVYLLHIGNADPAYICMCAYFLMAIRSTYGKGVHMMADVHEYHVLILYLHIGIGPTFRSRSCLLSYMP